MTATLAKEVRKLSVADKTQFAEDLYDDAAATADNLPVPAFHQRLLDARLAAHLESPGSTTTLEEFRQRLARRVPKAPPMPRPA